MGLVKRILTFPLLRLVWTGLLGFALGWILRRVAPSVAHAGNTQLLGAVRNAVLTTVLLALSLWLFEGRRRLRDVGLAPGRAVPDVAAGFALGAAMLTAVVGFLAVTGDYRIDGWAPLPPGTSRGAQLATMTALFFCVAIFEELSTRGILFRLLEEGLGTWVAIAISAAMFGFGHRGNPGATTLSSVAIALEAGVLLAAMYAATRSLWLPVGVHWAWNLFEGPVWGSAVSGNDIGALARGTFSGSPLLTGGAFGPEAGLPCMMLGGALGVGFLVLAVRRGRIVTPAWMRWVAARIRGEPRDGQGAPGPGGERDTPAGTVPPGAPSEPGLPESLESAGAPLTLVPRGPTS